MSSSSNQGDIPVQRIEVFNTPTFQALFRMTATVMLLFISVVTFIAVQALGDIKDLTSSINQLNQKLGQIVGDGRVTANTVANHEGRITALEQWRVTVPPHRPYTSP